MEIFIQVVGLFLLKSCDILSHDFENILPLVPTKCPLNVMRQGKVAVSTVKDKKVLRETARGVPTPQHRLFMACPAGGRGQSTLS